MAKAGRNDLCPCGSGKKYKKCCALKEQRSRVSTLMLVVLAVVLAGGVYAIFVGFNDDGSSFAAPGKVWSPEHGHYH
jgi:hypothetical protein